MVLLFKRLLHERIRPAMAELIMTLEMIFTLKIETLLTQRLLAVVNSQTNHIDRVYDFLQQEKMRQQSQVQEFTRELRSTISPLTFPPT